MDNNPKTQAVMLAEILRPHLREGKDADALAKELVTDFNLRFVPSLTGNVLLGDILCVPNAVV